jgi:RimJ/RimL family protein N-acetyltransferase
VVDVFEDKNSKQVVKLREVEAVDLAFFFKFQLDTEANQMAAFTRIDPSDLQSFDTHLQKILADGVIPIQTILYDWQVAGPILSYVMEGEREVSYWLGSEFLGKGIATQALILLLEMM